MGIARTIERVKQQAKQGGLEAVRATLGEELRSRAIPAPLRSAAQRLAALLDPTRQATQAAPSKSSSDDSTVYQVSYEQAAQPAPESLRSHAQPRSSGAAGVDATSTEAVGLPSGAATPAHATLTGNDSGASPEEPPAELEVDPALVGATPTFDATPVEAAPIDATPVEAAPLDATPALIEPLAASTPHGETRGSARERGDQKSEPARRKAKARTDGGQKPAAKAALDRAKKEKLADHGGAAKTLARSSSRGAKQRTSPKADTTSKKK